MEKFYKPFILLSAVPMLLLIGVIDYGTGAEISLSIFYLFPVALVAWYINKWAGLVYSILSGVVWYQADVWAGLFYSTSIAAFWNAAVRFGFFILVIFSIGKLKTAYRKEQMMARTDMLTGVFNARHFYDIAETEIARAKRYKHSLSIAFIDIDNFKTINDSYGHPAGDNLLRDVADTIKSQLRSFDIFARVGGDEFIVMLPETNGEAAHMVMERIQSFLNGEMKKNGWPVTLSIGAITFNNPSGSLDDLVKKADSLMYRAKESGKNRILYDEIEGNGGAENAVKIEV